LDTFNIDHLVSFSCLGSENFDTNSVFLTSRVKSWLGGSKRWVESWSALSGILLKVEGCSDFYISSGGQTIIKASTTQCNEIGLAPISFLSDLDREILLGPALILALALRNTWSFHASAARFQERTLIFLGESGQGKSTLTGYLARSPNWQLVADDILPATIEPFGVTVWPHFPQLKLPLKAQPSIGLPEKLPLGAICLIEVTGPERKPAIAKLSSTQATQALLSHTAGTRLFTPSLLAEHLDFSVLVAQQIPAYRLTYPHRRDVLPQVQELLEKIC